MKTEIFGSKFIARQISLFNIVANECACVDKINKKKTSQMFYTCNGHLANKAIGIILVLLAGESWCVESSLQSALILSLLNSSGNLWLIKLQGLAFLSLQSNTWSNILQVYIASLVLSN